MPLLLDDSKIAAAATGKSFHGRMDPFVSRILMDWNSLFVLCEVVV